MTDVIVKSQLGTALAWMVMNSVAGLPASRRKLQELGVNQRYWNLAQAILVLAGYKDPKHPSVWLGRGRAKDFRHLGRVVHVSKEDVLVETDFGWKPIDLVACHFLREKAPTTPHVEGATSAP